MNDLNKTLVAWGGTLLSLITLNNIVMFATLIFTILQICIAVRKLRQPVEKD